MKKLLCLLLIVLHSLVINNSSLVLASEYCLAPGDILEVKVIGQDNLATKQTITPDGTISLPMLDRLTASGFSKYINKPQVVVYLTPRPIYVVQHDQSKKTWDVKEAKSVAEAQTFMGHSTSDIGLRTSDIEYGAVLTVEAGNKPDWWEQNWYKVLTGVAVVAGVYATVHK